MLYSSALTPLARNNFGTNTKFLSSLFSFLFSFFLFFFVFLKRNRVRLLGARLSREPRATKDAILPSVLDCDNLKGASKRLISKS